MKSAAAKRFAVARIPDREQAAGKVVALARAGAATAWIHNTVSGAVEAADALRESGLDPILFHSRFVQGDRARIEDEVLAVFGKASTTQERRGRVLVATQVVEQSIDVDFDAMVSDLAPADLLLQRAGRLWRHPRSDRPAGFDDQVLHIVSGDPDGRIEPSWVEDAIGPGAFVYRDASLLLRSARALLSRGAIKLPRDARDLVEEAYDEAAAFPDALREATQAAQDERAAHASLARRIMLDPRIGYSGNSARFETDEHAATRLIENTATLRLARRTDRGGIESLLGGSRPADWARSEVSFRLRRRDRPRETEEHAALAAAHWATLGARFEDTYFALVDADGTIALDGVALRYDSERGLQRR